MAKDTFDIILLHGRPASGKSEIIDYLKRTELDNRIELFHIGEFEEIDDFPMLWVWFEEDDILEKLGHPRLHTTADKLFKDNFMWDLLIRRIGLEYGKRLVENRAYHDTVTTIIEFSRGSEHGGYKRAYKHLTEEILKRCAILYIDVSFDESLRKNRARFNPDKPHSILEHGLPDEKLKKLYGDSDWEDFVDGAAKFVEVKGIKVPFAVFENEDDVTTGRGEELGKRLIECMGQLWKNREELNAETAEFAEKRIF